MKNSGLFLNMAKGCFFVCFFFRWGGIFLFTWVGKVGLFLCFFFCFYFWCWFCVCLFALFVLWLDVVVSVSVFVSVFLFLFVLVFLVCFPFFVLNRKSLFSP